MISYSLLSIHFLHYYYVYGFRLMAFWQFLHLVYLSPTLLNSPSLHSRLTHKPHHFDSPMHAFRLTKPHVTLSDNLWPPVTSPQAARTISVFYTCLAVRRGKSVPEQVVLRWLLSRYMGAREIFSSKGHACERETVGVRVGVFCLCSLCHCRYRSGAFGLFFALSLPWCIWLTLCAGRILCAYYVNIFLFS